MTYQIIYQMLRITEKTKWLIVWLKLRLIHRRMQQTQGRLSRASLRINTYLTHSEENRF
ncbi:hypothetical protein COTS27_00526 [Spirochaetota bacterium]|nr:hypothetical protein COTS27_00526 [Spirochaetota bacterium]